jgi:hypothetical protein
LLVIDYFEGFIVQIINQKPGCPAETAVQGGSKIISRSGKGNFHLFAPLFYKWPEPSMLAAKPARKDSLNIHANIRHLYGLVVG